MSELQRVIDALHPLEARVLIAFGGEAELGVAELAERSGLGEAQVRMALEWMGAKGAVAASGESRTSQVSLTDVGKQYAEVGTPEVRILERLKEGAVAMDALRSIPDTEPREISSAIGELKALGLIEIGQGGTAVLAEGAQASMEAARRRQSLVERLARSSPLGRTSFTDDQWGIIEEHSRKRGGRGTFQIRERVSRTFRLSDVGRALREAVQDRGGPAEEVSQLTPELLREGAWRSVRFREYNLDLLPPRGIVGRRNPYREFLDIVKRKLLSLGFEEMRGPMVESEFWNMDALYMPQFHAARQIHDAYFLRDPTHCREIPEPALSRVAAAHHDGEGCGSTGWRYEFDIERTRRLVLRSQGTALSIRQLGQGVKVPGKYFAIARCFRYDRVDATHAPDFFQIEGIVLGEEINFCHLLGLLKLFALEVAKAENMRFVPAYFPFTEPSVEIQMEHPKIGWMELGGAGIFRPEVTKPQGVEVPVIAWGLGLDRMAMVALGVQDIRDLFSGDLEAVRQMRSRLMD